MIEKISTKEMYGRTMIMVLCSCMTAFTIVFPNEGDTELMMNFRYILLTVCLFFTLAGIYVIINHTLKGSSLDDFS